MVVCESGAEKYVRFGLKMSLRSTYLSGLYISMYR